MLRTLIIRPKEEPLIVVEKAATILRSMNLRRIALSAIGLLLLGFLLSRLEFGLLLQAFVRVSLRTIIGACLMQLLIMLLKWMRWRSILRLDGIELSISKDCLIFLCSFAIGVGTPGQVGEVSRAYFLKREIDTPYMHGVGLIFLDRLSDVFCLGVFGLTALVVLQSSLTTTIMGVVGLIVTAVVVFIWAWSRGKLFKTTLQILMSVLRWKPSEKHIRIAAHIDRYRPRNMAKPMALTLLSQVVVYGQILVVAYGFSLPKSVYGMLPIIALANIASVLPISIAGLGTRESVYLYFIDQAGQCSEQVMAFSLTTFCVSYLLSILVGMVAWQVYARRAFI